MNAATEEMNRIRPNPRSCIPGADPPREHERGGEVDGEVEVPVAVAHVVDPLAHVTDAGVRHEHVHGAELALHVGDEAERGGPVGEVGARGEHARAAGGELAGEVVGAGCVAGVAERD